MYRLLSFADSRLYRSAKRLKSQAESLNFFSDIKILSERDLSKSFREKYGHRLIAGSRGFGYWIWKPEIILNELLKLQENDCLIYLDIGCHLNPKGILRLQEYFDILNSNESGILAFQANPPDSDNSKIIYDGRPLFDQPNFQWIKGDLFNYFNVREETYYTHSQAVGSTVILLRKTDLSIKLISEWRFIMLEHFNLIDDSPSISPNLPGFIENRHDQAVFTLLCLKHKVTFISAYEYWYRVTNKNLFQADWDALDQFPIHAKRDKDLGFFMNSYLYIHSFCSRVYKFFINRLRKLTIK